MEVKGTIKVRKDSKLGMYRYLTQKALINEDWESYDFWSSKFDTEWVKVYGVKKERK